MPVNYATNQLVSNVKRRAGVPSNESLYTNQDILDFVNEAMYGEIVPIIISQREQYFIESKTYVIEDGKAKYPIPAEAIGGKLRSIGIVNNNDTDAFAILPQIDIEQIGQSANYGSAFSELYFYFEGNNVVLYPTPNRTKSDVSLRLKYYRRPNELVTFNEGALISNVNTGTFTLNVNAVPTSWAVGDTVDIVAGRPPFDVVASGIEITASTPTTLTFSSGDLDNVSKNDTVALEGFSIIPNIAMPEAHNLLVQAGVVRLLEGVDDGNGLQTALALYERQKDAFRKLITPRADSSSRKIVAGNDFLAMSRRWNYYR